MSFAGQQETYLNIRRDAQLLDAVKRCWASLWTPRAIDYRAWHGVDHGAVRLAVVVQELVPADAAGVLFTSHPVTGAREEVHINAAWGLGEAIVSGQVTPDALVVNKATGKVEQQTISDKTMMTVPTDDGTRLQAVAADRRRAPVLLPEEAGELASFLRAAPSRCEALHDRIRAAGSGLALGARFRSEIEPFFREASEMLQAAGRQDGAALVMLRRELRGQVGEADANALMTGSGPARSRVTARICSFYPSMRSWLSSAAMSG